MEYDQQSKKLVSIPQSHQSDSYGGDPSDEPSVNPDGFFNDLTNQNACSVRVAVRVRPLVGRELYEGGQRTCVDADEVINKLQIGEKSFQFDRVFSSACPQQDLFEVCGRNLVLGCFAGYNATILAYGQTGSGKTHTMGTGSTNGMPEEQLGIVPRVFRFIFEELDRRKKLSSFSEFTIKVSFLELYNEELHDLLDPVMTGHTASKSTKELLIKEKNGNIYVQGLKEEHVSSKEECTMLLNKGISHRTTSATLMNEGSSRSHGIFTITIEQRIVKEFEIPTDPVVETSKEDAPAAGQQEELISAKFHFVDLAGSERIKRTGATGVLLKEGISINKGLLCLGNVISALTEDSKKQQHIPYRDSKLTRILQDSLGGNSRTTMIACVSPAESNYEETLNAIKYASRARNIKNKPVVNRDPNSMLIDSLRQQISNLTGEVKEYQDILRQNNIGLPDNFTANIQRRASERATPTKIINHAEQSQATGSVNHQEIRELKVNLSRKEKELKDLKEQLQLALVRDNTKDQEIAKLMHERDNLRLKNEILSECVQQNNISVSGLDDTQSSVSIIDEYKNKLAQLQKDLEKKDKELLEQNNKVAKILLQTQNDQEIMKRHLEENQRLKRQIKRETDSGTNAGGSPNRTAPQQQNTAKFKMNLQHAKTEKEDALLKKQGSQMNDLSIPSDLNDKFINNLASCVQNIFQTADDDSKKHQEDESQLTAAGSNDTSQHQSDTLNEEKQAQAQQIQEQEKILDAIKSHAKQMQDELVELMKNEYEKKIQEIEKEKLRVDNERQDNLKKVSQSDAKQAQVIDQQYKQKMEELNKQLSTFKEKEKKQDQVSKQVNAQLQKIRTLEEDLTKLKKKEEDLEKQRKNESQKYNLQKQTLSKELGLAKKMATEKEKAMQKLKLDLKKVDQQAQKKISELKGFQKRVLEERLKKEQERKEELESKGIDIDRIKNWITENTNKMLEHKQITDQLELQIGKKEQIEEEMLLDGEKLTNLMIDKDRMEFELQQLQIEDEPDEGRIIELEEDHYQKSYEIDQITERLDSQDETLTYVNNKINLLSEEAAACDVENIEPIKFSGLQSVEAAKVTLQTFFSVLLNLNIYNRDLEVKCIESDEAILGLNEKIGMLQARMHELAQNTGQRLDQVESSQANNRINNQNKDKAIKNIVDTLDGFVDYSDLKNLNLTPNEQNSLTKLSLSKIVSNLKSKLREEENKNQNLSHKLEQALNDKEQFKLKLDNLKKKKKDEMILKQPLHMRGNEQQDKEKEKKEEKDREKERETKFSSLAQARERRKQVLNPNQSTSTVQTAETNDTGLDIVTIPKSSGGTSNLHLKYKAKIQQQRPQSYMEIDSSAIKQPSGRNHGLTSQGSMNMSKGHQSKRFGTQSVLEPSESDKDSATNGAGEKRHPTFLKKSPKKMESGKLQPQQQQEQLQLKKQLVPINEYRPPMRQPQQQQPPVKIPNFKDRRNARKMENNDEGDKVEPEKVLEIDKIKEETQMIAQGQAHKERRQSRLRAFSKRGFSSNKTKMQSNLHQQYQIQNINNQAFGQGFDGQFENMRDANIMIKSPRVMPGNNSRPGLDMDYDGSEYSNQMDQATMSPSRDMRNKWSYEELAQIEFQGQRLIGCDYADEKIIMVFEDFSIREVRIDTLEEISNFNVFFNNQINHTGETVVDFCLDRDLNAIAICSSQAVYVFDYQDGYKMITRIDVENIQQVLFCSLNVIVLVKMEEVSYVVSYQIGDEEPVEQASFEIQTGGYLTMLKTDNINIFFSSGITIGRLEMPELTPTFVIETEHSDVIINFSVSQFAVVTTSRDSSLRCYSIETGEQTQEVMTDIDCDYLETDSDFILTRCGMGQAFLIWKYSPFKTELELIDEIAIEQLDYEVLDFKMRGKIMAKFNSIRYNLILLITSVQEGFLINTLKHKPLSEY